MPNNYTKQEKEVITKFVSWLVFVFGIQQASKLNKLTFQKETSLSNNIN